MKLKRRKATNPKQPWTKVEETKLLKFLKSGKDNLGALKLQFPNRQMPSIKSKVRKLRLKYDLFGKAYREEKEVFTIQIAKKTKPKTVFEAYGGVGHQTFKWLQIANTVYTAEKNANKASEFQRSATVFGFSAAGLWFGWKLYKKGNKKIFYFVGDAMEASISLRYHKIKIDLVDLDTCGTTIPTIPLFLNILRPKDLVITHGEFHSMRFMREDVLRRIFAHRDVNQSPLPLTIAQMSNYLDNAVKVSGFRANNETQASFWLVLKNETWLGSKFHGMLRRHYKVTKPRATSDCLNILSRK